MNIKFLLLLIGIILTVIFVLKYNIESFDDSPHNYENKIGNIIGIIYNTGIPDTYEMKLLGLNRIEEDTNNNDNKPYLIELTN